MEGNVWISADPTPTYEPFETITVRMAVNQVGGGGFASIEKKMTPEEARAHISEVLRAVEIVEQDR